MFSRRLRNAYKSNVKTPFFWPTWTPRPTHPWSSRRPRGLDHLLLLVCISRFDDKDEEDRWQLLLSRCTVQLVNVALLLTAVLLRRLIVRAEPRSGNAAADTIHQKVEKHTGVLFSRAHARFFYEVAATSLGIPFPVLDAVLGSRILQEP
mgnify:CR=1 FL=1